MSKKLIAPPVSMRARLIASLPCVLLLLVLCFELFKGLIAAHAAYPTVPNTIFLAGTRAAFTITTAGTGGSIAYSVTDLSGATITTSQSGVTNRQANLTLPTLGNGYYVLTIDDHTVQSSVSQAISFAVVAPFAPVADSPFGVSVHFTGGNNPGLAPLIAGMGVGLVRDDASWAMIERTPGRYDFGAFDPYMQMLQQNNVAPLLILDYNDRFYDNSQTPYDSAGFTAFANYAKALVSHYGPQLKEVEVYNEYNALLSNGPCARKASCYVELLRYTYQAIKAVRPDVTVIGGAAFGVDLSWFGQVFQAGGLRYMDAVSDHPYTAFSLVSPELGGTQDDMLKLGNLVKQYNGGRPKPIWITELGWSSSFMHVSERGQADYLVRGAVLAFAAGVQKFFWYDLLNDGNDTTRNEQNFGLLRRPDAAGRYQPKPAYVAYAVLARMLAHQAFVGSDAVGWGVYDERFTNNLRVLWSTPGNRTVIVTSNDPVTVTSMTGAVQTYRPAGGHFALNLSPAPVYLQGNGSKVSWCAFSCS
ncbi:MAG: hypothetical protein ABI456_12710 [Ktedonobacteraceae bacterium]